MNLVEILSLSVKDFFTKEIIFKLFLVIIVSILIAYIGGFYLLDSLFNYGNHYNEADISNSIETNLGAIPLVGIYIASIVIWIVVALLAVIGAFLGFYASVLFSLIIAGLLTPSIVKVLIQRRGGSIEDIQGFDNFFTAIFKILGIVALHFLTFVLLIPLMFIPLVNALLIFAVLYSFFRYMLVYDVGSNYLAKKDYKNIVNFYNLDIFMITLVGYFASSIPFIGIFSSIFTVIALFNYFHSKST
ncbi:MAG: hypothetical protein Ctma_1329 [Catillopecten margaritatus gill symbiont]|uniref:Uncharacterized protein n=1 Tax=Catillopecten margaritatus gill symbiont TaxID=3083288 RepID=A0AAU6PHW5_9GAMM